METEASPERLIREFDAADAADLSLVGGKGANLALLVRAGFPVPPGFCVTAQAYDSFVRARDLRARVMDRLDGMRDVQSIAEISAEIRADLVAQPIPPAIADQVRAAYQRLGSGEAAVAVRSSATAEDLPEASFAGQQDTYLNVRGADAVLEHIRRCWASLWTARAVTYRMEHGFAHEDVLLAVVVQAMIESDVAGVMFTANPVSGRRDETVINASFGLGEAVVSGLVTPDTYVVQPRAGLIRQREIGRKEVEVVYSDAGTVDERPIEGVRATRSSLTDDEVVALAELGTRVEDHYGAPQDLEWALYDGQFYVLQSRPITTLGEAPEVDPADQWTRAMFIEILPDAPSPVFCSVLEPILTSMLDFTFRSLGQTPPDDIPAIDVFYHQPYMNVRYIRAALSGLPEASRERLTDRIANPFGDHGAGPQQRPSAADLRLAWQMLRAARSLPKQLPKVIGHYYALLAEFGSREPSSMPDDELARSVKRLALEVLPPLVEYDFLLIAALGFTNRLIDAAVARSGVPEAALVRGQLMSGVTGNATMKTNKRIWQLAQGARHWPGVDEAILACPDEALLEMARAAPGGPAFSAALDEFLAEFGHREVRMDIAYPTWGEDPLPVLRFVKAYLAAEGAPDPAEQERVLAEQRRAAADAVHAGLGRGIVRRLVMRPLFRWAMDKDEALGRERDTMHFHWTATFPVLRRYLKELGERAVEAGVLDHASDVYCLTLDDLEPLLADRQPMQAEVARRRHAWERDKSRRWPLEIRHGEEVYEEEPSEWAVGREALRGIAGSPGEATGTVRIVRGPEDFGKLGRGEVLVAPLTNPVWTPLFAIAGAVVTDSGGILSHGAIVAREYGIPAVMGVRGATATLRDGQRVTVDGVRGTVTIADESHAD